MYSAKFFTKREIEEKTEFPQGLHGHLVLWSFSPYFRHFIFEIFIKTLIIMHISINIHIPYVCDPLGSYISLINNYINTITSYRSNFISYLRQKIY